MTKKENTFFNRYIFFENVAKYQARLIIIPKTVPFPIKTSLNRKSRNNMQTFPRGDVQRNPSIFSHKETNIYVFFFPR